MPDRSLTSENAYQTSGPSSSWLGRCCPSAVFYAKILGIVYRASKLAQKGLYDNRRWIESSLTTVRALETVGGRLDVLGLENVQRLTSPAVFIGNHMSILETFVLPCLIQPYRNVTFVVKESLITYPFFGHVMRSRDPVVVGRANPREDLKLVMEEGGKRLEANVSVVIFPQTTRSAEFDPGKFNSLGIKLARRCNVPAVPFALKTDAWGLGKRIKDFGPIRPEKTVHFHFGAPMKIRGSGKEEHAAVMEFIRTRLAEWS
jgi:1-acyl-sn-glycerol-3-phosphate acyltransferase